MELFNKNKQRTEAELNLLIKSIAESIYKYGLNNFLHCVVVEALKLCLNDSRANGHVAISPLWKRCISEIRAFQTTSP